MQVQPHVVHHLSYWIAFAGTFLSGNAFQRFLVYVSKQMPPLPPNSGWWTQLFYALMKGASGLDPSATIIPPKP